MFIAHELRIDPVTVLTETDKNRRAARLAAAQLLRHEHEKANKKK